MNEYAVPVDELQRIDAWDLKERLPRPLTIVWRTHEEDSELIHFDAEDPKVAV